RNFTNPKPLSGAPATGRRMTSRLNLGVAGPHDGPTASATVVPATSTARARTTAVISSMNRNTCEYLLLHGADLSQQRRGVEVAHPPLRLSVLVVDDER